MLSDDSEPLSKVELFKLLNDANAEQTKIIKQEFSSTVQPIADKVDSNAKKIIDLENKIIQLDRKTRRKNIVIFGLEIINQTDFHSESIEKINNLLGLNIVSNDISNIYQLKKTGDSIPPIFIEFVSLLKKDIIFQNISKLKGSGIAITHDLSYEDRQKHKILYNHLKKARSQKISARIVGDKLEIDNKLYTAEQLAHFSDSEEERSDNDIITQEEENPQKETNTINIKQSSLKRKINKRKPKISKNQK